MARVGVFVDVFEVGIERVVIEIEIGIGIAGALPHVRDVRHALRYSTTWGLRSLGSRALGSGMDISQS